MNCACLREKLFVFMLLIALFVHEPALLGSVIEDNIDNSKVSNCGYNCALVLLVKNGLAPNTREVMRLLKVEPNLQQAVSFADLRKCFEHYGYKSAAFGSIAIEDVKNLGSGVDMICQLNLPYATHFILVNHKSGEIVIDDYPQLGYRLDFEKFKNFYSKFWTGNILLISKPENFEEIKKTFAEKASGMAVKVEEKEIPIKFKEIKTKSSDVEIPDVAFLPKVRPGQDNVIVDVDIKNSTNGTIEVEDVRGECSCFTGSNSPFQIKAHSRQTLRLHFNLKNLLNNNANDFNSNVALKLKGSEVAVRRLSVLAPYERDSILILPNDIKVSGADRSKPVVVSVFSLDREEVPLLECNRNAVDCRLIPHTKRQVGKYWEVLRCELQAKKGLKKDVSERIAILDKISKKELALARFEAF